MVNDLDAARRSTSTTSRRRSRDVFGYPDGKVTVQHHGLRVQFHRSASSATTSTMPDYRTTLTAESAGEVPDDIGATPEPTPTPEPDARAYSGTHAGADPCTDACAYAGSNTRADTGADARAHARADADAV